MVKIQYNFFDFHKLKGVQSEQLNNYTNYNDIQNTLNYNQNMLPSQQQLPLHFAMANQNFANPALSNMNNMTSLPTNLPPTINNLENQMHHSLQIQQNHSTQIQSNITQQVAANQQIQPNNFQFQQMQNQQMQNQQLQQQQHHIQQPQNNFQYQQYQLVAKNLHGQPRQLRIHV